jgi:hypothetical protein
VAGIFRFRRSEEHSLPGHVYQSRDIIFKHMKGKQLSLCDCLSVLSFCYLEYSSMTHCLRPVKVEQSIRHCKSRANASSVLPGPLFLRPASWSINPSEKVNPLSMIVKKSLTNYLQYYDCPF